MDYNLTKELTAEEVKFQDALKSRKDAITTAIAEAAIFAIKDKITLTNTRDKLTPLILEIGFENGISKETIFKAVNEMIIHFPTFDPTKVFATDLEVIILNLNFTIGNRLQPLNADADVNELIDKAGSLC
jgi:hypothetical protein